MHAAFLLGVLAKHVSIVSLSMEENMESSDPYPVIVMGSGSGVLSVVGGYVLRTTVWRCAQPRW